MRRNIKEIINTKKGNINLKFWRNIIVETKKTSYKKVDSYKHIKVEEKIIKGWICDFYHRMKENVSTNSSDLVDEILEATFKIKQGETNEIRKYKIYTGITDLWQDSNSYVIEPIVNNTFLLDNSNNENFDDWIPNFLNDL